MSTYKVQDNSTGGVGTVVQLLQHFFPYAQKQLGFHKPVMISFDSDEDNASKLLGRTGQYNPDDFSISIYVDSRHPKDILRSLSHELVHHAQNCNGDFDSAEPLGVGYAQENPAMRNAELDAYKRGNIIFRDFEDLIKKGKINVNINFEEAGEPKMSLKEWKHDEINTLLMEKWGYGKKAKTLSEEDKEKIMELAVPPTESGLNPAGYREEDKKKKDAGSEFLKSKGHDPETGAPFKGTKTERGAAKHQHGKEKSVGAEIEDIEEGCPPEGHEDGEALDISGPGMEVHVDDISNLSPEEAFAAGMAAAKDAIDQAIGGDVPPEGGGALEERVAGKPLTRGRLQPRAGHEPPDLAFKRATGYKNCEDLKAAWNRAENEFEAVLRDPHHPMSQAYPHLQADAKKMKELMQKHCSDVLKKGAAAGAAMHAAEKEKQRARDKRRAAEKYYTDMAEGRGISLTLDEARDVARRIFERITQEKE